MSFKSLTPFRTGNQIVFSLGSMSFNMMERMMLMFVAFYYLPPKELGEALFPDYTFFGIFTIFGLCSVLGRVFDAVADPVIASMSDNSKSPIGRRKLYMVLSAFPMFLATALIFYPIFEAGSILNGLWLGFFMAMFYIFFTAYANPFLALVSELGQNQSVRINISTFIALFGLIGVAIVTVMFEETAFSFMGSGMDMRNAYSLTAVIFAGIACVFGYISVLGFKESKHCMPSEPAGLGVIDSLKRSYSVKHFRIFLTAELSVMFCVNILTMGLAYYASVLFQQPMMYVAGIALGGAAVSFYFVNKLSKVYGKKIIIIIGVIILSVGTLLFFILSFNLTGISVYLGYLILLCLGFPLAALSTLMYSTTADIAREDALRTGIRREAMFYGARAVPLKLVIALSGIVFGVLLSVGRDIANPLGIQLSLIVVSVVSVLSLFFFTRYPEKDVLESLEHYERQLDNPEGFAAEIEQKPLNA